MVSRYSRATRCTSAMRAGEGSASGLRPLIRDLGQVVPLSQIAKSSMSGDELGSYAVPQPGAKGSGQACAAPARALGCCARSRQHERDR